MTPCWVKPMLALLILGIAMAFVVSPVTAGPIVRDFQAIGAGTTTGTCQTAALASGCSSSSTGEVTGKHIGSSAYTLGVTAGTSDSTNSSGGTCLPANGTGTITAANGDVINLRTVGWVCEQSGPGSNYHYNGTYFIDLGTGRFAGAIGAGNLAAGFAKGSGAPTFLKLDGTINY